MKSSNGWSGHVAWNFALNIKNATMTRIELEETQMNEQIPLAQSNASGTIPNKEKYSGGHTRERP